MIKSFKHKGLKLFYQTGSISKIQAKHIKKLRLILGRLDVALEPRDLNLPGLQLHKLTGNLKEFYAVTVQANWRVIFKFEGCNVTDVNLIDYH